MWTVPIGLRKTPQSFPPMQIATTKTTSNNNEIKPLASAKSALTVSFCPETKEKIYKRTTPTARRRDLFSTRSLRLAASKLAEASPRLRRRNKSVSDASRSINSGWFLN